MALTDVIERVASNVAELFSRVGKLEKIEFLVTHRTAADLSPGATSARLNVIPAWVREDGGYLVLKKSGETEVRRIEAVDIDEMQVSWNGALANDHTYGETAMFIDEPRIMAQWFGGHNSASINLAGVQAYGLGDPSDPSSFGIVHTSGTWLVANESVKIYGFVRYSGDGRLRTVWKLDDNENIDVVKSDGFDTYSLLGSGQGGTQLADGIPIRFAIEHLTIDGNKANNTAGDGVKLYGMGFYVGDVYIHSTAGMGYYSELQAEGEDLNWWGIPQAEIMRMVIRDTDGTGFLFRGPHDANIDWLTVSLCAQKTGDNIIIDNKTFSYASGANYAPGSCDIGFVHSTGSGHLTDNPTGGALSFTGGVKCRCRHLIADSPRGDGYYNQSNIDYNQISILQTYKAGHSSQLLTNTSPAYAKFYDGSYTDLSNAIDGNAGTSDTITFTTSDKIYIGYTYPFNVINWDLGGTVNAVVANMTAKYYDAETAAFAAVNDKDDYSQVSSVTWAQDGRIEFLMPRSGKWAKNTIDGVEAYWVELAPTVNLTANVVINEITVRYQRWCANIRGQNTQISNLVTGDVYGAGSAYIRGVGTLISSCDINGRNSGGTGLVVDANRCTISGYIRDYDSAGGIGMITNPRTNQIRNIINMHINNCDTCWVNPRIGAGSEMHIDIFTVTGQTIYSGVARGTAEKWYVVAWSGTASKYYYSEQDFLQSAAVSLTSTTQQTITINHDLMLAPRPETVPTPLLYKNTAVTDWAMDYIRLDSVSSTQIIFHVKLGTASATGGATAHLLVPRVMV